MTAIDFLREEFVGFVEMPQSEFFDVLHDLEFEARESSFLTMHGWFRDYDTYTLHVETYEQDGRTYIFAHREEEPDGWLKSLLFGPSVNGPRGVNRVRTLLNKYGIEYKDDPAIR